MDSITQYFELVKERPDRFIQSEAVPLILDETAMRAFSEKTGRPMGVVFDNAPFFYVLSDLCRGAKGSYAYSRILYCNPDSNGSVAIVHTAADSIGLLTKFRHAGRQISLECPRGFHENPQLTREENIQKELAEELSINPMDCKLTYLGEVQADSGLAAGTASVYAALVPPEAVAASEEEGNLGFRWYTPAELSALIAGGGLTDGFTLSAYLLYLTCQQQTPR